MALVVFVDEAGGTVPEGPDEVRLVPSAAQDALELHAVPARRVVAVGDRVPERHHPDGVSSGRGGDVQGQHRGDDRPEEQQGAPP